MSYSTEMAPLFCCGQAIELSEEKTVHWKFSFASATLGWLETRFRQSPPGPQARTWKWRATHQEWKPNVSPRMHMSGIRFSYERQCFTMFYCYWCPWCPALAELTETRGTTLWNIVKHVVKYQFGMLWNIGCHVQTNSSSFSFFRLAGGSVKLIGPCHRIDGWEASTPQRLNAYVILRLLW